MPKDYLSPEYLTRSDIARILKISPRQAGRLMEQMPCVPIGPRQRRVARPDFEEWIERKKFDALCEAEARRGARGAQSRTRDFERRNARIPSSRENGADDLPRSTLKVRPLPPL